MTNLSGYSIDEIDRTAIDLLQTLSELGVDAALSRLALCRAIIATSNATELDEACVLIDDLSEVPLESPLQSWINEEED